MAVTFVGVGSFESAGSGTSRTPTLPSGWQENDIFVMHCSAKSTSTHFTPPGGWTSWIDQDTSSEGGNGHTQLFWKRAGASESNPTVNVDTAGSGWSVCVSAYRGCVTSGDPADATAVGQDGSGSTTITSPSITTATNGAMVVKFYYSEDDFGSGVTSFSSPQTEAYGGVNFKTSAGTDHSVGSGYYIKSTAGASGTDTATQGNSVPDAGIATALTPAAAGGGSLSIPVAMNNYRRMRVE